MTWFPAKKKHKFGAKRITVDGRSFMSKGESACYGFLKARESAGEISNLRCQVHVKLTKAEIVSVVDFAYEENGETVYAEYKGFETEQWRIKRRLWKFYGPGKLVVYKGSGARIFVHEEIIPHD